MDSRTCSTAFIVLLVLASGAGALSSPWSRPTIYFVYSDLCQHCMAEKPLIDELERKYPDIRVERINALNSKERIDEASHWIEEAVEEIKGFSEEEFVFTGVAGTVTTHVSVAEKMRRYDSERVHHYILTRDQILENLK